MVAINETIIRDDLSVSEGHGFSESFVSRTRDSTVALEAFHVDTKKLVNFALRRGLAMRRRVFDIFQQLLAEVQHPLLVTTRYFFVDNDPSRIISTLTRQFDEPFKV